MPQKIQPSTRDSVLDLPTDSGEEPHYSNRWQLLEQRHIYPSSQRDSQFVWGVRYIDDLILRDRDKDLDGGTGDLGKSGSGYEERIYALTDALFNVTALADTSGTVLERYEYDPYGMREGLTASFVSDYIAGSYQWKHYFTCRYTRHITQVQLNRNRFYHTALGRWFNRDPIGYAGGDLNLYGYVRGRPTGLMDPYGLWWWDDDWIELGFGGVLGCQGEEPLEEAGKSFTENAGQAHVALQTIAVADPTGLALATDATLQAIEGEQLHQQVMQGVPPRPAGLPAPEPIDLPPALEDNPPIRPAPANPGEAVVQEITDWTPLAAAFVPLAGTVVGTVHHDHHIFPQEFRDEFEEMGIPIDDPNAIIRLPADEHIGKNGIHPEWNEEWEIWLDENPGANAQQAIDFAVELVNKFEILQFRP